MASHRMATPTSTCLSVIVLCGVAHMLSLCHKKYKNKIRRTTSLSKTGMDFHSVLEPLLSHGNLDGNDLCALASVSKFCRLAVDWDAIKQEYAHVHSQPLEQQDVAYICWQKHRQADERMGFTKTLVKYRLTTTDVAQIPRGRVTYGDCIEIKLVVGVAMLKHGGPAGLRRAMQPKHLSSKARSHRIEQLSRLNLSDNEKFALMAHGLDGFLKNGYPGINTIKQLVNEFRQHMYN